MQDSYDRHHKVFPNLAQEQEGKKERNAASFLFSTRCLSSSLPPNAPSTKVTGTKRFLQYHMKSGLIIKANVIFTLEASLISSTVSDTVPMKSF